MYRVLLVDDEAWILAGLQAMVDWRAEGFEICAAASNGVEAEKCALELRPDFILADIRMPGCDGLTLLQRLRQAGCTAMFAIVSGYAEFSYAQEAIRLGACGYLLKPIEEEELLALLRTVRTALTEQYEQLLMGELEQETGRVAALFPEGCWVTSVYGDGEIPAEKQALRCRVSRRSTLYLSEEKLFESENDVPEGYRAGMERCVPGEGDPFPAVAAACREASWQGFVQPERRLFRSSELAHPPVEPASPLRLIALYRERLPHVTMRQLYALYLAFRGCADDVPPDSPEWLLDHFESAEKLLDFLASELQQPEERADESVSIAAYLKKHFQEDVSLDSVSHALSMSVSSVRRTLQRETGETFQQVLVALRMERASVLLKEKTLSINEVAFVCGFHDALYFRRAFKKRFGLTPSEYRARAAAK